MDATEQIAIERLKSISAEDFLSLLRKKEALIVQFANGEALTIRATIEPAPLPKLDGYVPQGWKDAIYND